MSKSENSIDTANVPAKIEQKEKETKQPKPEHTLSFMYRFFCWCSGARLYIVKKCPTDYNTFFGIGIVIFLTGIMATISGSYAFLTVFNIGWLSVAFGLFWGTLIFFLDWYLVSSLRKQNKKGKELLLSFPRFVFAIFLAVVISKPIELKLFEREINEKIASIQQTDKLKSKELLDMEFEEIDKLLKDNEQMAMEIKSKEMLRNNLFTMVINEAEGKAGTGIFGKGPVYQEKKDALEKAEKELAMLQENFLPLIKSNTERIGKLKTQRDELKETRSEVTEQSNGFLARIDAMGKLSNSNRRIKYISWFIVFLFIAIESAPIFVKLISARGAYDEFLDAELYHKQLEAKRLIAEMKTKENKEYNLYYKKELLHYETALENDKEFTENIKKAQQDINEIVIQKWKQQELKNIEQNFEQYASKIKEIIDGAKMKGDANVVSMKNT